MKLPIFTCAACILLSSACKNVEQSKPGTVLSQTPAITPPNKEAVIQFVTYELEASKGDTFFYESGSILLFPANAFVDAQGKPVKGKVQVKYREFRNAADFYLSGIPMQYDSAGKSYTFESSGMCEVLAFQNGVPVFVNPASQPEINMSNRKNYSKHNLYYYDTVQQKWLNKGKPAIVTLEKKKMPKTKVNSIKPQIRGSKLLPEPVKPQLAQKNQPIINVEIDPASFRELQVYNNLKFQIDESEMGFKISDADELWKNIKLSKLPEKGKYIVSFENEQRTVQYKVVPVVEAQDYEQAIIAYNNAIKQYNELNQQRLAQEKTTREQYTKDSLENEQVKEENKRIEANNKLVAEQYKAQAIKDSIENAAIIEQNKKIERLNRLIEERNKEMQRQADAYNRAVEQQNAEMERRYAVYQQMLEDSKKMTEVIQSFRITGFGIWNCDQPYLLECIYVNAQFKDADGNTIDVKNIAVVYKSFNGIMQFYSSRIGIRPKTDNMIIGTVNGRFVYIGYDEFRQLKINDSDKPQTFKMTTIPENENNYNYIKRVMEQ